MTNKTKNHKAKPDLPPSEKMLAFVIEMMTYPFKCCMGSPDPKTGATAGRPRGDEYCFSFSAQDRSDSVGCVYGPTAREAIAKGMRLRDAQKKGAELVERALAG